MVNTLYLHWLQGSFSLDPFIPPEYFPTFQKTWCVYQSPTLRQIATFSGMCCPVFSALPLTNISSPPNIFPANHDVI